MQSLVFEEVENEKLRMRIAYGAYNTVCYKYIERGKIIKWLKRGKGAK